MKDKVVTFALASVSKRKTVQFSPEGLDILHCLILRWAKKCFDNYESTKAMERDPANPLLTGQATYWRNAGSFLKGMLLNNMTHKFNCSEELKALSKHYADGQLPDGWEVFDTPFTAWVNTDGTFGIAPSGGGGDCDGADRTTGPKPGRGGEGDEGKGDGPDSGTDSPSARRKTRKGTQHKGKVGAKRDRHGGGQRKPSGNEA